MAKGDLQALPYNQVLISEKTVNKMENKTEKDFLIFAAMDEEVIKEIGEVGKAHGKAVVRLEDKVLSDYLKRLESEGTKPKTTEEFVRNEQNIALARQRALELWEILSYHSDPAEAKGQILTKSAVVRNSNLSNKQAQELLDLLKAFGFINYTKGSYEFEFIFDDKARNDSVTKELMDVLYSTKVAIEHCLSVFVGEERENVRTNTIAVLKKIQDGILANVEGGKKEEKDE